MKKYTDKQRLDFVEALANADVSDFIQHDRFGGKEAWIVVDKNGRGEWRGTLRETIDAAIRAQEKRK